MSWLHWLKSNQFSKNFGFYSGFIAFSAFCAILLPQFLPKKPLSSLYSYVLAYCLMRIMAVISNHLSKNTFSTTQLKTINKIGYLFLVVFAPLVFWLFSHQL